MDNNQDDNQQEIICSCSGTTKEKIHQLFDKGIDDLDKISSATGAVTGCGSCDATIMNILKECKEP